MSTKKVIWVVVLTNVVWLSLLAGLVTFTRTAQAQPAGSASDAQTFGPFYQSFSGADLHSFRDDFSITREDTTWGVLRQSQIGVGTTGVQLPPGATITQIMNDSNDVNGPVDLRLRSCAIGQSGFGQCTVLALASVTTGGRHQVTQGLLWATNPFTEALHLEILINNNNSVFYNARIAYTLPAPLILPLLQR
jgi:hypothetical protein